MTKTSKATDGPKRGVQLAPELTCFLLSMAICGNFMLLIGEQEPCVGVFLTRGTI